MKKIILIAGLLLVASNGWAWRDADLEHLKSTKECYGCDLIGARLADADLRDAILYKTNFRNSHSKPYFLNAPAWYPLFFNAAK